ncbi:hypothetical protein [Kineococcus sp. SYSU DK002]|uniref:hypothetical protein n=1 Tax=Kineococcus sp. SYSU DK002 TaxID=3383123 RepID=UPI003D7DA6AD
MPTLRSIVTGAGGAVLLLAAVAALAVGREALNSLVPAWDGLVLTAATWGAVAAGSWLLVHAWNTRRPAGDDPAD